ncbi:MAG: hypothetical protein R3190_07185, partial [Thermoanaerobaculia bacterium]|nr:hypothetical protein [Thermoanaerobaculia bacterium]
MRRHPLFEGLEPRQPPPHLASRVLADSGAAADASARSPAAWIDSLWRSRAAWACWSALVVVSLLLHLTLDLSRHGEPQTRAAAIDTTTDHDLRELARERE